MIHAHHTYIKKYVTHGYSKNIKTSGKDVNGKTKNAPHPTERTQHLKVYTPTRQGNIVTKVFKHRVHTS